MYKSHIVTINEFYNNTFDVNCNFKNTEVHDKINIGSGVSRGAVRGMYSP